MPSLLAAYIAAAVLFLALDFVWLGIVAKEFYARQIGHLLSDSPNLGVAGLFYLGYVAGVIYFVVRPALEGGAWTTAALNGALLGLLAYGTYDITNLATLRGWPWAVVILDMAWGAAITAAAASAGFAAARWSG